MPDGASYFNGLPCFKICAGTCTLHSTVYFLTYFCKMCLCILNTEIDEIMFPFCEVHLIKYYTAPE